MKTAFATNPLAWLSLFAGRRGIVGVVPAKLEFIVQTSHHGDVGLGVEAHGDRGTVRIVLLVVDEERDDVNVGSLIARDPGQRLAGVVVDVVLELSHLLRLELGGTAEA